MHEPTVARMRTFLVTDIVGSTQAWDRDAELMGRALAVHDRAVTDAISAAGGEIVKHTGDGFLAAFESAAPVMGVAVTIHLALADAPWPAGTSPLQTRMSIHSGEALNRGGDYFGLAVSQAARLNALAAPGQVLVSDSARAQARAGVADVGFVALGEVRLRGVSEPILVHQLTHPSLPTGFPPIGSSPAVEPPVATTGMIGRDRELAEIVEAVATDRIVTLVGVGGVGKTRLAIAACGSAAGVDEVWWCDLSAVTVDDDVGRTVLSSAGLSERAGQDVVDAISAALGPRHVLLAVDNAEHVVEAATDIVVRLVRACPGLSVLCTSRQALDVPGERVVTVAPLPADGAAIALFTTRARAADPSFTLDGPNAGAVADICRTLDGIPLALELAAARVRSLAPTEIAELLVRRFRIVRTESRHGADRHRSIEAALTWSVDLLSAHDRELFVRLSVFAGSFDVESVEAIVGDDGRCGANDRLDVVDALDRLVRRSMIEHVGGARSRYRLLETMKAFGRERLAADGRLDDLATVATDHAIVFAERTRLALRGRGGADAVAAVKTEMANLRAAFHRSLDAADAVRCTRLVAALDDYMFQRMAIEIGDWAVAAVSVPGAADLPHFSSACVVAAFGAWLRGDAPAGRRHADAGLLASAGVLQLRFAMHLIDLHDGHLETSEPWAREELALVRAAGDDYLLQRTASSLAYLLQLRRDPGALDLAREGLAAATRLGNIEALAHAHWGLAYCLYRDDPEAALAEYDESIGLALRVDAQLTYSASSDAAKWLQQRLRPTSLGDRISAAAQRASYWMRISRSPMAWLPVSELVVLLVERGDHQRAALLHGARAAAPMQGPISSRAGYEVAVNRACGTLGARFDDAATRGSALTPDEIVIVLEQIAGDATSAEAVREPSDVPAL